MCYKIDINKNLLLEMEKYKVKCLILQMFFKN